MKLTPILALGAALALCACGGKDDKAATAETPATTTAAAPAPAAGEAPQAVAATFDLTKVPVSTATLGAFPYVPLPAGYTYNGEKSLDLAAFPSGQAQAF